jgi:hypothetical protein
MSIGARFSNPIYVGYTSDPFLSQEPLQKEFLEFPVLHNLKTLLMEECGVEPASWSWQASSGARLTWRSLDYTSALYVVYIIALVLNFVPSFWVCNFTCIDTCTPTTVFRWLG